jgi:hypothetical protein
LRRRPNPWIALPALALGALAATLGWVVTDVSCRQPDQAGTCVGWAALIAIVAFVTVTVGVTLILVLVYRSIAEWREGGRRRR